MCLCRCFGSPMACLLVRPKRIEPAEPVEPVLGTRRQATVAKGHPRNMRERAKRATSWRGKPVMVRMLALSLAVQACNGYSDGERGPD